MILTCIDQLQKLAEAIREKRPRRASLHLLHDNARAHATKATQQKLLMLGWNAVPHPPYSPDIAPSDYHLFRPLREFYNFWTGLSEQPSTFARMNHYLWK